MVFLLDKKHLIIYNYQGRNGKKMYLSHLITEVMGLKANYLYIIYILLLAFILDEYNFLVFIFVYGGV